MPVMLFLLLVSCCWIPRLGRPNRPTEDELKHGMRRSGEISSASLATPPTRFGHCIHSPPRDFCAARVKHSRLVMTSIKPFARQLVSQSPKNLGCGRWSFVSPSSREALIKWSSRTSRIKNRESSRSSKDLRTETDGSKGQEMTCQILHARSKSKPALLLLCHSSSNGTDGGFTTPSIGGI